MESRDKLAAATHMGTVLLDVRDLANMTKFYHFVIGLDVLEEVPGRVTLGRAARDQRAPVQTPWLGRHGASAVVDRLPRSDVSTAGTPLLGPSATVVLRENKNLSLRPEGSAGLFHTAILFQNPRELAAAVIRISRSVPQLFAGTGDHNVSQAFYLDDPEGNGVELYVDRPRDTWTWNGGQIRMTTEYLDPAQFISDHTPGVSEQVREGGNDVSLGHVHLQVGDVKTAHWFYVDTLGFEETARMGRSALFVSAGGYHHHMAMNTWGSAGAGLRAPSLGLGRVDVVVPGRDDLDAAVDRLKSSGFTVRDDGRGVEVNDPWENLVRLSLPGA